MNQNLKKAEEILPPLELLGLSPVLVRHFAKRPEIIQNLYETLRRTLAKYIHPDITSSKEDAEFMTNVNAAAANLEQEDNLVQAIAAYQRGDFDLPARLNLRWTKEELQNLKSDLAQLTVTNVTLQKKHQQLQARLERISSFLVERLKIETQNDWTYLSTHLGSSAKGQEYALVEISPSLEISFQPTWTSKGLEGERRFQSRLQALIEQRQRKEAHRWKEKTGILLGYCQPNKLVHQKRLEDYLLSTDRWQDLLFFVETLNPWPKTGNLIIEIKDSPAMVKKDQILQRYVLKNLGRVLDIITVKSHQSS